MKPSGQLTEPVLERMYTRLEKPLYNVVYRWVWDSAEASDIVQEAFVRLWSMRARVRLDSADALVYKIALNLASKRRRHRKTWGWTLFESWMGQSAEASAETALSSDQTDRAVRDAVDALPEHLRSVVMLCAFSEMSYAEVAKVLDIPPGTVGSRRNKALAQLRDRLGEEFSQ